LREECQDLVTCLDGRLAGRVDQVGGHNAVRARNLLVGRQVLPWPILLFITLDVAPAPRMNALAR
jgi:hypothetical protein